MNPSSCYSMVLVHKEPMYLLYNKYVTLANVFLMKESCLRSQRKKSQNRSVINLIYITLVKNKRAYALIILISHIFRHRHRDGKLFHLRWAAIPSQQIKSQILDNSPSSCWINETKSAHSKFKRKDAILYGIAKLTKDDVWAGTTFSGLTSTEAFIILAKKKKKASSHRKRTLYKIFFNEMCSCCFCSVKCF